MKKLALIGGGHSHLLLLKKAFFLSDKKKQLLANSLTVISSQNDTVYSGMLPRVISGKLPVASAKISVKYLCDRLGIQFISAGVNSVEVEANELLLDNGDSISADVYSWNIGLSTKAAYFPQSNCGSVRPVDSLIHWWQSCQQAIANANRANNASTSKSTSDPIKITVVGGGVASVELVLAMHAALAASNIRESATISLLSSAQQLLPDVPSRVQSLVTRQLDLCNIDRVFGASIAKVQQNTLVASNGAVFTHDFCLWAAAKQGPDFIYRSGLQVDSQHCIEVDNYLQSVSHKQHFAAGDIASLSKTPHTKNGVYAVRHADYLFNNLLATLFTDITAKPFKPQRRYLSLIDLSDGTAIAVKGAWSFHGRLMLWLKNRIDDRFVKQFKVV